MIVGSQVEKALKDITHLVRGFPPEVVAFSHYLAQRLSVTDDGTVLVTRTEDTYTITPQQFLDRVLREVDDFCKLSRVGVTQEQRAIYDTLETWIPAIAKAMDLGRNQLNFGDKVDSLYFAQRE